MKLYPPYKSIQVEIQNIEKFEQFLKEDIEYNNSNHKATLKGKRIPNGFIVERKLITHNSSRPQIKGIITSSPGEKHTLTISIESRKTLLYIVIFFTALILITAVYRSKPIALIVIPIIAIWVYFGGFILHSVELKKTKIEVQKIIEKASSI